MRQALAKDGKGFAQPDVLADMACGFAYRDEFRPRRGKAVDHDDCGSRKRGMIFCEAIATSVVSGSLTVSYGGVYSISANADVIKISAERLIRMARS